MNKRLKKEEQRVIDLITKNGELSFGEYCDQYIEGILYTPGIGFAVSTDAGFDLLCELLANGRQYSVVKCIDDESFDYLDFDGDFRTLPFSLRQFIDLAEFNHYFNKPKHAYLHVVEKQNDEDTSQFTSTGEFDVIVWDTPSEESMFLLKFNNLELYKSMIEVTGL